MLKSVMFFVMLAGTALRLVDMIFLLSRETVNLAGPVIFTTWVVIIYGAVLSVRRFLSSARLRPMMFFFIVHSAVMLFNIFWVALSSPLVPTGLETLVIGSFLEILIEAVLVYLSVRQTRKRSIVTVGNLR